VGAAVTAQLHALDAPRRDDAPSSGYPSLFVDEAELRRRVAPHLGEKRFRAAVRAAELRGFPQVKALWGGRYWPAVVAWLDNNNGVRNDAPATQSEDGPETFADQEQRAGIEARPHPAGRHAAMVLDGPPGRARPARLSGRVRAAAGGR
jgi:hypothetical protein